MNYSKKNIILLFWTGIFIVLVFLLTGTAQANTVGLSVNQTVFSADGNPGEKQDFKLSATNVLDQDEKILIEIKDFSAGDNNSIALLDDANPLYGMKDWINLKKTLILKAHESAEISFTVSVPGEATVGSHYAAILIQAFPNIDAENFQSPIVTGRIGAYVLINVKGNISGKGKLNSFKTPFIYGKNATFQAEFENQGNIHYIPHGEISVKNIFSRKASVLGLEKHYVFPGEKYAFEKKWNPPSLFGAYVAEASFVDGNGQAQKSKRYIFGGLFFAGLFIVALAIIYGAFTVKKLRFKKKNEEAK